MSDTPETDKAGKFWPCEQLELVDSDFARRLERERDEALKIAEKLRKERFEARKLALAFHEDQTQLLMENAKLRDIADRAIKLLTTPPVLFVFPTLEIHNEEHGKQLRAELDQLKEGGK